MQMFRHFIGEYLGLLGISHCTECVSGRSFVICLNLFASSPSNSFALFENKILKF